MKYIKQLTIDIDKKNIEVVQSVQYDSNTRFIHINLVSNSMPFDISGCSVKVSGIKPDNTGIFNNCTVLNAKEGFIEVEVTEQMNAVEGLARCELKIYDGRGVLTTKQFNINVTKSVSSKTIESSNEFRSLTEALNKVQNIDNRFNEIKEHCTGGNGMQEHSHVNKTTIDQLSEEDNLLFFKGKRVGLDSKIQEELTDIRVGADGKVYDSAGESIRNQINKANENITSLQNNISVPYGTYTEAIIKSQENNVPFQFLLKLNDFTKPIWHIGDSIFIDSVGAVIEEELNEKLIYNFTYKVKLTTDNEIIYVPVTNDSKYDMYVDWGDGSEETYFTGVGILKSCYHTYSGNAGDIFTITLYGSAIPKLDFSTVSRGGQQSLFSVENNTLKNDIYLSFNSCSNLTKIAKNTFNNYTGTTINFSECISLSLIENGFSEYINKSNITNVSFGRTKINSIDDDLFDGMMLTSVNNLFRETKITSIPSSLPQALTNCSSFYYTFYKLTEEIKIPNNLFDYVEVDITDVRNCFNGGSATSIAPLTGDAKILYDKLSSKINGTNYSSCFSNNTLSNLDQVPTSWGGKM